MPTERVRLSGAQLHEIAPERVITKSSQEPAESSIILRAAVSDHAQSASTLLAQSVRFNY